MRRTKIVCTLGPATDDVEIMKELIRNGLDAARVNFSHGTYETHGEIIKKLKQAREELNAPIPLILDTKGPEIRIKTFENNKIRLEQGDKFTLTTEDVPGTQERVSVTYADLPKDLQKGSRVLIDDGLVELRVESIVGPEVHCEVVTGGMITGPVAYRPPQGFFFSAAQKAVFWCPARRAAVQTGFSRRPGRAGWCAGRIRRPA